MPIVIAGDETDALPFNGVGDQRHRFAGDRLRFVESLQDLRHVVAVKLDDNFFADGGRKRETFPIPADTVNEIAIIAVPIGGPVDGALDAPIMGDVEGAPARVVEMRVDPIDDLSVEPPRESWVS